LNDILSTYFAHLFLNYDNRIEIDSPGLLLPDLTVEDMKVGVSKVRNPMIARIFRELGKIESWGSGVPRLFEEVKRAGLSEPTIEEVVGRVRVTIFVDFLEPVQIYQPDSGMTDKTVDKTTDKKQVTDKTVDKTDIATDVVDKTTNTPEELILDYLSNHSVISSSQAQELLGKSQTTVFRIFKSLLGEGKIIASGANKARVYALKPKKN
jgi:predicted HTH transcriptional regulator